MQRRSVRSAPRDVPERAVREGQPEHAHRGSSVVPGLHRVAREDVERQQQRRDADAQDEHEGPLRGGPTHARGGGASQLRLDALAHFPVARVGLGGLVARVLSLGHPTHGVRGGRSARAPVTRSATRFARSFRRNRTRRVLRGRSTHRRATGRPATPSGAGGRSTGSTVRGDDRDDAREWLSGDHVRRAVQRQVHRRRRARVRAPGEGDQGDGGGRAVAAPASQRGVRQRPRREEHPRTPQGHRGPVPPQRRSGGHRGCVQRHQGVSIRALVHREAGWRQVVRRALRCPGR